MITSKEDYKRYVAQDMKALGAKTRHPLIQTDNSMIWLVDPVARYQRLLRRLEYWENCRTSPGWLPLKVLLPKGRSHRLLPLHSSLWQHRGISPCTHRRELYIK